eukprot:gnl/TRDRNA2_/TRDRNA2_188443_c0_seq1.p1 gnl/TRDRNA2_/TRDRNA2_188443_c0~~gnl/TRDRNA2_/TRDRNA2_188443_c0_seq1.p1  ORF type:complete len:250 (+),score=38.07 gnl/TRDRNA2_/TRDRNA2_188443_c0_seq1:164-913(+)
MASTADHCAKWCKQAGLQHWLQMMRCRWTIVSVLCVMAAGICLELLRVGPSYAIAGNPENYRIGLPCEINDLNRSEVTIWMPVTITHFHEWPPFVVDFNPVDIPVTDTKMLGPKLIQLAQAPDVEGALETAKGSSPLENWLPPAWLEEIHQKEPKLPTTHRFKCFAFHGMKYFMLNARPVNQAQLDKRYLLNLLAGAIFGFLPFLLFFTCFICSIPRESLLEKHRATEFDQLGADERQKIEQEMEGFTS